MKLKYQLLFVSLLTLSLPWAGCQFIKEVEQALRKGQEQSLQATATAMQAVLQAEPTILALLALEEKPLNNNNHRQLFPTAPLPIFIDGYDEDWNEDGEESLKKTIRSPDSSKQVFHYRALTRDNTLYLFIEVRDQDLNYYSPSENNDGDHIVLVLGGNEFGEASRHYRVASGGSGRVNVRYTEPSSGRTQIEPSIKAHWQGTIGGFNIELSIPISLSNGRFGLYRVDQNSNGANSYYGTIDHTSQLAEKALYTTEELSSRLALFSRKGLQLKVINTNGTTIAKMGSLDQSESQTTYWMLRALYRAILQDQQSSYPDYEEPNFSNKQNGSKTSHSRPELQTALQGEQAISWYQGKAYSNRSILSIATPLKVGDNVAGAILAERSSEEFLALTDSAFTRLFTVSLTAMLFTALGLLSYASWLSFRIRRLSQAAEKAIADDQKGPVQLPQTKANDEIGDLSRSYSTLLERINEYTEYLQGLSSKLSHELRTPLAVVQSSLDNLEKEVPQGNAYKYIDRAKGGIQQLRHILSAMSAASHVEASIKSAEKETLDIVQFLRNITQAYDDTYQHHSVQFDNKKGLDSVPASFAPELIAQMFDKLLENAADFAPHGSTIEVTLETSNNLILLSVSNEGPALSENMHEQLFQNMVSLRNDNSSETHLGLGLHIVKLIANFHQGDVRAYNLVSDIGVCFEVSLPFQAISNITQG